MGQAQQKAGNENMKKIGIQGVMSHTLSRSLENGMKGMSEVKLTENEVELHHESESSQQKALKFIGKQSVETFKKYSGYGEIYNSEDQKIFEGSFLNGVRNGFGIQYDEKMSIIYQGFFKNNAHDGWGITPDYEGEFLRGRKCGWGRYTKPKDINGEESIFYEGYWQNDHCHGTGALNVRQEEIQDFLKQKFEVDLGPYDFKYVGQWRAGQFSGIGKLVKRHEIYYGQFVKGLYEGSGTVSVNGEAPVKGEFLQGKRIG